MQKVIKQIVLKNKKSTNKQIIIQKKKRENLKDFDL